MPDTRLIFRTITIGRMRTSMRLEGEMWHAIGEICSRESITIGELVRRAQTPGVEGGRTNAVRNYVLSYFREAANESTLAPTEGWQTAPLLPNSSVSNRLQ